MASPSSLTSHTWRLWCSRRKKATKYPSVSVKASVSLRHVHAVFSVVFRSMSAVTASTLEYVGRADRLSEVPLIHSSAVRRAWITTLGKLRSKGDARNANDVISMWITLGRAHGLEETAEAEWLASGAAKTSQQHACPWQQCGWTGCMCHEQQPLHKLSACTGCWETYYCGKKCQKKCASKISLPREAER